MRPIITGLVCTLSLLLACGADDSSSASDPGTTTSATNNPTTGTTADMMTTAGTTTATTDETTGVAPTTTAGTGSSTGGDGDSAMEKFGHACEGDDDCVAVLGAGGVCLKDILGVYGLPGGYCSKICMLPDAMTAYVPDDPTCGAGVTCIGAMGFFEGCAVECTDNSQCPRTGYECRIMPQIGKDGDPKFCLMTEDNKL